MLGKWNTDCVRYRFSINKLHHNLDFTIQFTSIIDTLLPKSICFEKLDSKDIPAFASNLQYSKQIFTILVFTMAERNFSSHWLKNWINRPSKLKKARAKKRKYLFFEKTAYIFDINKNKKQNKKNLTRLLKKEIQNQRRSCNLRKPAKWSLQNSSVRKKSRFVVIHYTDGLCRNAETILAKKFNQKILPTAGFDTRT